MPRATLATRTPSREIEARIRRRDIRLFDAVYSQTTAADRQSLLLLQQCVRKQGTYVYLEIGSYQGGTLQPHYGDPRCQRIYSIDKRPVTQPDERGRAFGYPENSTARMRMNLQNAFPSVGDKLITFDCDATAVAPSGIVPKPHLCFIDGEHTNAAAYSDFRFCQAVAHHHAIIAFHDPPLVAKGICRAQAYLRRQSIPFRGFMLTGDVYVILLNETIARYAPKLQPFSQDAARYFRNGARSVRRVRLRNRFPRLFTALRWVKRLVRAP